MEIEEKDQARGDAAEDFPDEFNCCVCLDLFYKPIVLACGHLACFWCVFKAMNSWQESYCPVCRHPYNHFPSICRMLHFVLLKLYPVAYKRREAQVTEEEKEYGSFSPQFDDYLCESHPSKEFTSLGGTSLNSTSTSSTNVRLGSCSTGKEESSLKDPSEVDKPDKDHITTSPGGSSYESTINMASKESRTFGNNLVNGSCKQLLITDLLCAICNELLYKPVVLNCGHVYCEACIVKPSNKLCTCPVCQSMHPSGFPKVCLVLEHFLEGQFPKEYSARRIAVLELADCQNGSPSTGSGSGSAPAHEHGAQSSSVPSTVVHPLALPSQGPKVHYGVGCDHCGMCPVIGKRYKCRDCVENIGFDLCEGCYYSSSKLPGRFNQQHTPDHKFEIVHPIDRVTLLWRQAEDSEEDDSEDIEDLEEVSQNPDSSGEDQLDPEAGSAVPNPSNDPSENQQGTNSSA